MQHCESDDLALMALGELADDGAAKSHVEQCEKCQAELQELTRIVSIGRSVQVDDQPVSPPATVWEGITSELAGDRAAQDRAPDADAAGARVIPLASRRPRTRWMPTAIAAASCLVLGGVVGAAVVKSNDGSSVEAPFVVASATLEPVPGGPDPKTTGIARVERVNGQYVLQVQAAGLRPAEGFYEVWMMDPANSGLVAIGTFNANQDTATFPLPSGLSMTNYNSVDISDEPFDGVPGHSKVSVLRGTLTI